MRIAVYCGSDTGLDPIYMESASSLGRWISEAKHTLIYGGGDAGLMGAVAKAAFDGGSEVIGVLPGNVPFIVERPQPYVTELVVAQNMSERKEKMLELADAFIALPGGIGTLDEISEVITLTKIGVFDKPCILFNKKGFYEPLRHMIEEMEQAGFLLEENMQHVLFSDDVQEIGRFIKKEIPLSKVVADIRTNWAIADAKRDEGLTTPPEIRRFDNISYGKYGTENLLDIYVQKDVTEAQATIVNIHGGGWVYGNKEIYQYYCMQLALKGFTVVNINYRLAPEHRFPIAVEDINQVMTFIAKSGEDYFIDKDNLIMVGDSAGGQLVSHYAAIVTDPDFAKLFSFKTPDVRVKALGLNCGAYDGRTLALSGTDEVFSEYLGIIGQKPTEELLAKVDTLSHITENYPPSFVMSACNDFLLPGAQPMYELIRSKGVDAEIKIYGTPEQKEIGHVFHVDCKLKEAATCNEDECQFFRKYVG